MSPRDLYRLVVTGVMLVVRMVLLALMALLQLVLGGAELRPTSPADNGARSAYAN
jgi:hypothetical protein